MGPVRGSIRRFPARPILSVAARLRLLTATPSSSLCLPCARSSVCQCSRSSPSPVIGCPTNWCATQCSHGEAHTVDMANRNRSSNRAAGLACFVLLFPGTGTSPIHTANTHVVICACRCAVEDAASCTTIGQVVVCE
jgi:hypothetical protein